MSSLAAGRDQLQTDWREMNKAFCGMAIGGIEVAFGQSLQKLGVSTTSLPSFRNSPSKRTLPIGRNGQKPTLQTNKVDDQRVTTLRPPPFAGGANWCQAAENGSFGSFATASFAGGEPVSGVKS